MGIEYKSQRAYEQYDISEDDIVGARLEGRLSSQKYRIETINKNLTLTIRQYKDTPKFHPKK